MSLLKQHVSMTLITILLLLCFMYHLPVSSYSRDDILSLDIMFSFIELIDEFIELMAEWLRPVRSESRSYHASIQFLLVTEKINHVLPVCTCFVPHHVRLV